jgi:hypothetical protein
MVPRALTPRLGHARDTMRMMASSPLIHTAFGSSRPPLKSLPRSTGAIRGVAPHALDGDNADRLWQISEGMLAAT